jgi:hypothetical protein
LRIITIRIPEREKKRETPKELRFDSRPFLHESRKAVQAARVSAIIRGWGVPLVALALCVSSMFGQANPVTAIGPGTVVDDTQMGIFEDRAYSTLAATFGATASTMTLADASAFPNGEYWVIVCPTSECGIGRTAANGETVFVISKAGNVLTLGATGRRVQSNQTGSATGGGGNPSHAVGEAVVLAPGAGQFNRWAAEIASIQSKITNLAALETFFGVSFVTETGTHTISGTPTFSNATYSALFTGGNVGIGTTAPTSQLQVRGTGQSAAAVTDAGLQGGTLLLSDSGTAANNGGALLMGGQVTNGSKYQVGIKALLTDSTANGLSDMAFLSRAGSSDTALTEHMRITSTGNVGIGTATPGAALQVVSTTSADQLRVGYDTTNYYKIGRNSADGVLRFQGTQVAYNGYNFLSQAGTSSFFIKDSGSVGIGTAAPNASAILDLTSTTRALLIPRMTTTQRDALTAVNGMLIYNSTLNKFQGYEGGAWASLI